jgi:hypothetical protein
LLAEELSASFSKSNDDLYSDADVVAVLGAPVAEPWDGNVLFAVSAALLYVGEPGGSWPGGSAVLQRKTDLGWEDLTDVLTIPTTSGDDSPALEFAWILSDKIVSREEVLRVRVSVPPLSEIAATARVVVGRKVNPA